MNVKRSYKQGSIQTDNHPSFRRGQIVDIISETKDAYLVQSFITGNPDFVKKEDVKIKE